MMHRLFGAVIFHFRPVQAVILRKNSKYGDGCYPGNAGIILGIPLVVT